MLAVSITSNLFQHLVAINMRTIGVVLRNISSSIKCVRNHFNIQPRFMSSGKSIDLSGVYPPIPTPFEDNEDIAWDQLTHNLAKWEKVPFKGKCNIFFMITRILLENLWSRHT